jgi:hypothetical protein
MKTIRQKHRCFLLLALVSTALAASAQPELFGANTISTGKVFRGSFSPDGKAFYFFRKVTPAQEDYRIFVSQQKNGRWSTAEQLRLGGDYSDLYPSLSRDGKRMVFASYRPVPGQTMAKPDANLWYVDRKGSGWGEPVWMAAASTPGNYDAGPYFGPDGAIYFDTTTPDWQTTTAMVTRWNGKEYAKPERFEAVERWRGWKPGYKMWGGQLNRDGSALLLVVSELDPATKRPKTSDLWFSRRVGNDWTAPQPLGAGVNTAGGENFPAFTPDGRELIFCRDFARFYRISLTAALNENNRVQEKGSARKR